MITLNSFSATGIPMKKLLPFLAVLAFTGVKPVKSQTVPNGGFENFTDFGNHKSFNGWDDINNQTSMLGFSTVLVDSLNVHGGFTAAKVRTFTLQGIGLTVPGIMSLGIINDTTGVAGGGIPFSYRPAHLLGWYKYSPAGGDTCSVEITLSKWNTITQTRDIVASGFFRQDNIVSSYNQFAAPIAYYMPDNPDTMIITIMSSIDADTTNNGSTLYIDDLSFNGEIGSGVYVSGTVFLDANQNQVFDVGEQPARNQLVHVGPNFVAITNYNGNYVAFTDSGSYAVRPELRGPLTPFSFLPDSIVVAADSFGIVYGGNDFAVQIPSGYCEAVLNIVSPFSPPRPGFTNQVQLNFTNVFSASSLSPVIYLQYDTGQAFMSANITPSNIDTVGRVITWNPANIGIGNTWSVTVEFRTRTTVINGTLLNYTAWEGSLTCGSSEMLTASEQLIVRGSYDPNDKSVSPVGLLPGGNVLPVTKLNYTIRFQNTGTYLAETVRITDTVSSYLDLTTLAVIAASHSYEIQISGREVTFLFNQINLPDSNSNEPMSHGYIKYSIMPSAGFVQGSVVENMADIYFDFNEPIRTNTVQNTADNFVSVGKVFGTDAQIKIYPNPLSEGKWQITLTGEMSGREINIYDARGKMVYSAFIAFPNLEVDASMFVSGIYFVNAGHYTVRVVKL